MRVFLQNPPHHLHRRPACPSSQYQFTLQSPDTDELYQYAAQLEEKMRDLPGFQDVTSDLQLKNPQVNVEIDRDKASATRRHRRPDRRRPVQRLRLPAGLHDPDAEQPVLGHHGAAARVPAGPRGLGPALRPLAERPAGPAERGGQRRRTDVGPLTINHSGQLPSVTISFNLAPGTSLGEAVAGINKLARDTLPAIDHAPASRARPRRSSPP